MSDTIYPKYGSSKAYDEQVEKNSEKKRAFYSSIARQHAIEKDQREAEQKYAEAFLHLQELEPAYFAAKADTSAAKKRLEGVEEEAKRKDNDRNKTARDEAAAAGEKTYMPVTPCRNGHYARRYVSSGACTECDKIGWKDGKLRSQVKLMASA